jgi:hypothetical protein
MKMPTVAMLRRQKKRPSTICLALTQTVGAGFPRRQKSELAPSRWRARTEKRPAFLKETDGVR